MQTQSSVSQIDEQLSAYFDDELDPELHAEVEASLERDPSLAERIADLSFMRAMVVGDLEHQAERVPEARFEQIWDSFEDTVERESRLQEAAETPPMWWQRLLDWARPVRIPLAALAGAGALAFVIARSVGAPSGEQIDQAEPQVAANTQDDAASEAPSKSGNPDDSSKRAPAGQPLNETSTDNPQIAVAPSDPVSSEVFPQPEPGETEIRRIEFGGQMGTISQVEGTRGTTTVIWVTEDDDPVDSERSL